ncbi:MAG: 50S ribosomal protein L11 methyltransferase [Eubacteriales bacterium]|nr:50S ribosomal protein L11 methyltransferase [Eubacteriales bacterium]
MDNNWIKVFIFTSTQGIEPVCGMLYQLGIAGVEIEDSADFQDYLDNYGKYWDYIDENLMGKLEAETCVIAYINDSPSGIELLSSIREGAERVKSLADGDEFGRMYVATDNVNEEDWANNWKKYYKPIPIGEKLIIKPSWEELSDPDGRTIIEINPGMMFGTGTHESTRMCMALLEECVTEDTRIFDVGAGSGILAVTALRLGAQSAYAVDIDDSVNIIAHENAKLNGVDDRLKTDYRDLADGVTDTYNLITANIVADVIIRLIPSLPEILEKDGTFICSGVILEREGEVKESLEKTGLRVSKVVRENDWVAIKAEI